MGGVGIYIEVMPWVSSTQLSLRRGYDETTAGSPDNGSPGPVLREVCERGSNYKYTLLRLKGSGSEESWAGRRLPPPLGA